MILDTQCKLRFLRLFIVDKGDQCKEYKVNFLVSFKKKNYCQHSGGRGRQISEFEASLVYKVSSRTARVVQKKTKTKQNKKLIYITYIYIYI
jgi:hypothetical protein